MITKTCAIQTRAVGPLEVEATMTTGNLDREGDVIAPGGWSLDAYMKNPVVLWGHDHKSLPVGRVTRITPTPNGLAARIQFPPEGVSARADEVRRLVKEGFLSSVSVGFRPLKSAPNRTRVGMDYHEQELLELSFVSVPANADAVVTAKGLKGLTECPSTACGFNPQLGNCTHPWPDCPQVYGLPTKGDVMDLADLPPAVKREVGDQLRVIEAAYKAGSWPGAPREEPGVNVLEGIDVTRGDEVQIDLGELGNDTLTALTELRQDGTLHAIVQREARAAYRAFRGL